MKKLLSVILAAFALSVPFSFAEEQKASDVPTNPPVQTEAVTNPEEAAPGVIDRAVTAIGEAYHNAKDYVWGDNADDDAAAADEAQAAGDHPAEEGDDQPAPKQ